VTPAPPQSDAGLAELALGYCSRAIQGGATGEVLSELIALQTMLEGARGQSASQHLTLEDLQHEWRGAKGKADLSSNASTNDENIDEWLHATLGGTPFKSSASTMLCDAAAAGDLTQLRLLVKQQGVAVNRGDYDKRTALHLAASEGLVETVKVLLEELGAAHSPCDRWGGTPLDDALRSGHHDTATYLVSKGAARGKTSQDAEGERPAAAADLIDAAASGDLVKMRRLVEEHGVSVNVGDYDHRTAIHLAASEGAVKAVRVLIEELNANHSPLDRWGNTPLDDAIRSGHAKVAQLLEGKGATAGVATAPSTHALGAADPSADLCDAAARGDVDRLRTLVDQVPVDKGDYDHRTAIHLAASEGILEAVEVLIELGADPSPCDRWGGTPLDDAIRSGHAEVAEYLLSKGGKRGATAGSGAADPSADLCDAAARGDVDRLRTLVGTGLQVDRGDYDRRTAIHLAASEGQLPAVKVLIEELGAKHSPFDRWGNTPLDDALRGRREAVVTYLQACGASHSERAQRPSITDARRPSLTGARGISLTDVRRPSITTAWAEPAIGGEGGASSLWVVPRALEQAFSAELFAPMATSEAAQAAVAKALGGFDGDIIALDALSGGHVLYLVGHALFAHHGLYESLHLDRSTARRFLLAMEAGYGDGPYHNRIHAADVALSVHLFLTQFGLLGRLSSLELLAAIVGALSHDFNHPATNNSHEVRVGTERALRHSDASVLERHHLHSTFALLKHPPLDLFARLSAEDRASTRALIVEMVLATDLSQHLAYVTKLRAVATTKGAAVHAVLAPLGEAWRSPLLEPELVDSKLLLCTALKWADLGHSAKPAAQHKAWTERVTNEFWALGDRERAMGIPVSPLCDRDKDRNIPKSQIGFFRFICMPLFSVVADLVDPQMVPWQRMKANLAEWERQAR
jgi:ankyrin repeat protein